MAIIRRSGVSSSELESAINKIHWQEPVLNLQTDATLDPGATPTEGDRYILTDVSSLHANFGSIAGVADNDIVQYKSGAFVISWIALVEGEGGATWIASLNTPYFYNGIIWAAIVAGVTDHGALTGLSDDDHSQYHNDTRGDLRYYTKTLLDGGQLNTLYFTESEFLNISAGAGDAGKPIKLNASGLIDASMLPTISSPVFGTEYQYTESLAESTTTSSTPQQKVSLLTGVKPAGTYRVEWTYNWTSDSTDNDFEGYVEWNDTTNLELIREEPSDPGAPTPQQLASVSGFKHIILASPATIRIDIDYSSRNNLSTVRIKNAAISLWRVS